MHLKRYAFCAALLSSFCLATASAFADTVTYANSTNPLAFFPLQSQAQGSTVHGYTTTYLNGASNVASNGGPQAMAVSLNGNNANPQYVTTSLSGGINGAGSISAYVNLAAGLNGGQIDYIAGESQSGNDFDLQFVGNGNATDSLCFYTGAGSSTCATVTEADLLGKWNMVTSTYNATTGDQDVYVNGVKVAENTSGSAGAKVDAFTIGYSPVFTGRDFNGLISDVGVWNYQLSDTQVSNLYNAATAPPAVTPEPSSFVLLGTGLLGVASALKRRMAA